MGPPVPDIYMKNHGLDEEVFLLRQEVEKARSVASTAKQTWDKFRKERDFHRMHHRRVVQEKVFIINLEGHDDSVQDVAFEPTNNKYLITASSDSTFCLWQ